MAPTIPNMNLDGLEVLVVEDEPVWSLLVSQALIRHGALVERAGNGVEALAFLDRQHFSVIVTDIYMPEMSGLELVSRIREHNQNIQVIGTSANHETDCLISAIELGFSDYLLKPVKIEKLILAVKRCGDSIACKKRLADEQRKFRAIVDCLGDGIAIKDLDFRIRYQNKALIDLVGERIGSTCYETFGFDAPCQQCPTILTLEDGRPHTSCRDYQLNGTTLHIESTASLILDSNGTVTGTVEIVRDIGERIRNEQTIRDLAFIDPLTGLANRRLFEDRLEQTIAKSRRYGMSFGLLTLDLDNFKDINDTLGHEAGDQVLREASERIRHCCKRDIDTISRQGGDEFCIIFTDCGRRERLADTATELLEAFSKPFYIDGNSESVTVSIGISMFPECGSTAKELEIASDRAMYAAKKAGRNRFRFWEPYDKPRARFETGPVQEATDRPV